MEEQIHTLLRRYPAIFGDLVHERVSLYASKKLLPSKRQVDLIFSTNKGKHYLTELKDERATPDVIEEQCLPYLREISDMQKSGSYPGVELINVLMAPSFDRGTEIMASEKAVKLLRYDIQKILKRGEEEKEKLAKHVVEIPKVVIRRVGDLRYAFWVLHHLYGRPNYEDAFDGIVEVSNLSPSGNRLSESRVRDLMIYLREFELVDLRKTRTDKKIVHWYRLTDAGKTFSAGRDKEKSFTEMTLDQQRTLLNQLLMDPYKSGLKMGILLFLESVSDLLQEERPVRMSNCLLYTSDAADE